MKDTKIKCPFCNSKDTKVGQTKISHINMWKNLVCNTCGKDWPEGFTIEE